MKATPGLVPALWGWQTTDNAAYPGDAAFQQHHQRDREPDQKSTDEPAYRRKAPHPRLRSSLS
jgi:hypothetical protein